jgi:hypothetical protein
VAQLACLFCLALSPGVNAQLPLSIEALLVPEKRWTASVAAARSSHREPVLAGTPSGIAIAWREQAVDRTSVALRYGLRPRLEVNAGYERQALRWEVAGGAGVRERGERVLLGGNWMTRWGQSSLLFDVRIDALARRLGSIEGWQAGAGGSIGATWYRPLDPVVLAVTARYRYERERQTRAGRLDPVGTGSLDASVNFALNRQVTLLGGLSLARRTADRIDGRRLAADSLHTSVNGGLAYAPLASATLFLRATVPLGANVAGGGVGLEVLYEF